MEVKELEKMAVVAVSNRTLKGLEDAITFIVNQTDCSKEEALLTITDIIRRRIC